MILFLGEIDVRWKWDCVGGWERWKGFVGGDLGVYGVVEFDQLELDWIGFARFVDCDWFGWNWFGLVGLCYFGRLIHGMSSKAVFEELFLVVRT